MGSKIQFTFPQRPITGGGKHDNLRLITSGLLSASSPGQIRGIVKEKSAIHAFYHQLLGLFKDALKAGGCPHCLNGHAKSAAEQSLCRLYIWAQGLDLHYLEHNVDKDSELQATMVGTLAAIAQVITSGNLRSPSSAVQVSDFPDLFPFGQHHKDKIDMSLISSYYDYTGQSDMESDSSDDDEEDDESTTQRHLQSLHQLTNHVSSLMDLLPTLHHSCNIEFLPITEHTQSEPRANSELPIAARRSKLAKISTLTESCQKIRAQAFGSDESETESDEEDGLNLAHSSFIPVSEFHDSGLGTSLPAKSKYAVSVASHSSFLSTQSAAGRGVARVPPTPADVEKGRPFICSICGELLENVKSRVDWKMHVFADLRPYICTFNDCKLGRVTFATRKMWADHEFRDHRSREIWRCFSCTEEFDLVQGYLQHLEEQHGFEQSTVEVQKQSLLSAATESVIQSMKDQRCHICTRTGFKLQRDFISHVGRHMEEIALITLSRDIDSDDEFDEESIISVPSLEIGQDTAISNEPEASNKSSQEDANEASSRIDLEIRADDITPTHEGFKDHVRKLNPRLEAYLVERIGQEQIRRYKRLVEVKIKHTRAVQTRECPSGNFCFDLGGEATYLRPRFTSNDLEATSAQFQLNDLLDNETEQFGFIEGDIVTPALFLPGIPLPPATRLPAEFECFLCFKVKTFRKPSDWTKHVHEDLQPFSCTFPNCFERHSYKRKADWVRHENERHRHLEWWQCPVQDCNHIVYRKDNFVQHLVREHKMTEPKFKRLSGSSKNQSLNTGFQEDSEVWRMVEACHVETEKKPQDEPCRFCGNIYSSFKKLVVHLGKHMEQIAIPVLQLVDMREVSPETIISPIEQPQTMPRP